jgi:hypothetical protein
MFDLSRGLTLKLMTVWWLQKLGKDRHYVKNIIEFDIKRYNFRTLIELQVRKQNHYDLKQACCFGELTISSPVMPCDIILLILSFICYNLGGGGWKGLTLSTPKNATIFFGLERVILQYFWDGKG